MSSPVCEVAAFGKNALNESVNVIVAAAALEIRTAEPTNCFPSNARQSRMPTYYGGATPP